MLNYLLLLQRIPEKFFNHYFENKVPRGGIKLVACEQKSWMVSVRKIVDDFVIQGFKKVCDEIPLYSKAYVVFTFVSKTTLKMSVFKPNGIQALLPLKQNERVGVVDCHSVHQKNEKSLGKAYVASSSSIKQQNRKVF